MTRVGGLETQTQQRVLVLFRNRIDYEYSGNWREREGNRAINPYILNWLWPRQVHFCYTHHQGAGLALEGRCARRKPHHLRRQPRDLQNASLRWQGEAGGLPTNFSPDRPEKSCVNCYLFLAISTSPLPTWNLCYDQTADVEGDPKRKQGPGDCYASPSMIQANNIGRRSYNLHEMLVVSSVA